MKRKVLMALFAAAGIGLLVFLVTLQIEMAGDERRAYVALTPEQQEQEQMRERCSALREKKIADLTSYDLGDLAACRSKGL